MKKPNNKHKAKKLLEKILEQNHKYCKRPSNIKIKDKESSKNLTKNR